MSARSVDGEWVRMGEGGGYWCRGFKGLGSDLDISVRWTFLFVSHVWLCHTSFLIYHICIPSLLVKCVRDVMEVRSGLEPILLLALSSEGSSERIFL
jgi:hypothetical protein